MSPREEVEVLFSGSPSQSAEGELLASFTCTSADSVVREAGTLLRQRGARGKEEVADLSLVPVKCRGLAG
jgi:hypothetical protein